MATNASVPGEGLDQLSLAQFAQRPAHRAAGDRVLAGKLILGRQGRAKRVRAIGYARVDVVGDLSPDRIIGRPLARHAGNSRSPPSQMTAAPGPARPISDHAQRLALVHVRCTVAVVRRGCPGRCRCRFRPRGYGCSARLPGFERGTSVGLLLLRAPHVYGRLMPAMATRTRSPHRANWPGFSRWLPTACWCGWRASHRTTTASAMRPWAGPPHDRFWSPVTRRPVVEHAIAAVAPDPTRWGKRMAGCPAWSPAPSATTGRSATPPPRGEEWSEK